MRISYEERTIWISTLLIMMVGLVTLYSASYENLRVSGQVFYDQLGRGGHVHPEPRELQDVL